MISQKRLRATLLSTVCLLLFSSFAFAQETGEAPKLRISTPEEIRSEFDSVPCKNGDRLKAVKALFEKMGAKPEEIAVEKVRGVENVVIRKAAANDSPEKIVISAHYDKTPDGCGAVDNWTGVVALAHVYRAVKDLPLKKNIIFAAFGKEEEGLVGSSGMVGAIKKEQVAEYCAMINIDSLGLGIPQALENVSSKKLIDFTGALAKEMNVPFAHARVDGASSDSASFISKKIPAVTLHALNNDWRNILHSGNDQPSKVNHESVYAGYRVALALLVRIDAADCQSFRDENGRDENGRDENGREEKEKK
ncbi:MAG: M28 family metallopeptidase [Blastocatellia bacterium]